MKHIMIDAQNPQTETIELAVNTLRQGGVIIYPTDTLYGLGVDVQNVRAVEKLYHLKGRNYAMPVSLMTSSLDHIEDLVGLLPIEQHSYLKKLLPGKITAIVKNKKKGKLHSIHRALDTEKLGFRVPDHNVCLRLAHKLDRPITTTSANRSGQDNIPTVQELIAEFSKEVDLFLDAGPLKKTVGSTIIDFTKDPYLIRRSGEVSIGGLHKILPGVPFKIKKSKFKITFICSGNICRSAMARVMMQGIIADSGLKELVKVDSAGTLHMPVQPAHIYAVKAVEKHGFDLHLHKSKIVSKTLMKDSDLVIALARNHFDYLNDKFPEEKQKIIILKQWGRRERLANPSIADPIGHEYEFFEYTYNEINKELKRIFPLIRKMLKDFTVYQDLKFPQVHR